MLQSSRAEAFQHTRGETGLPRHIMGRFILAGKQLDARDRLWTLEVDLEPFDSMFPHMTRPSSIGDGVRFLNR